MATHSPKWETIFADCDFLTWTEKPQSNGTFEQYRLFHHWEGIDKSTIDGFIGTPQPNLSDLFSVGFHGASDKFWGGTVLHACVDVLSMSPNINFVTSLKYLLIILLENNLVDDTKTNAYKQTPRDAVISNMMDGSIDRWVQKNGNLQYSVYFILSNLQKYKSTLSSALRKLQYAVFKRKHKMSNKENLLFILYSPPGQIEHTFIQTFPGGTNFHNAKF